jgi:hypothetical protein
MKKEPCTLCRPGDPTLNPLNLNSSQAGLRHPKQSAYRCFLPDLTGVHRAPPRRAQLSTLLFEQEVLGPVLEREFNPAIAGCGYRAPLAPHLARPTIF